VSLVAMVETLDSNIRTLTDLLNLVKPRVTEQELSSIRRAYELAEAAHHDQIRKSGDPYITHPLAVAGVLADIKLDSHTICAALLHDVVEDTLITLDDLQTRFGPEVAMMVDGVTKLSQREGNGSTPAASASSPSTRNSETFVYRTDREAESLRKMMLSIAKDVRVVLIKLADRLHNMRTLQWMKPEKQKRIARETLDIYAPLANRLGIWEWKHELEELGLRYAEAEQYTHLTKLLELGASDRAAAIRDYIETVRDSLHSEGVEDVEITGRAKSIYSLWRKMQRKNTTFDGIRDTQAIRIIIEDEGEADEAPVDNLIDEATAPSRRDRKIAAQQRLMRDPSVQACYTALGVIHQLWPPIPGEFDDYIAVPKDNHYQSLHTAVQTTSGMLEVQIRTRSMHRSAEFGVAAHWLYKDNAKLSDSYLKQIDSLRSAIDSLGSQTDDAESFVDALQTDQLQDLVFAFTPKGKVVELPTGATILDFAYRIHSDIGDRCRGGRVNGAMQPVSTRINNGDVIEILTRKDPMPSRDWLYDEAYCITTNAKHKIRAFFRKQDREQNILAGREVIERELRRMGVANWMKVDDVLRLFKVDDGKESDFLERIGFGNISSVALSNRIMEEDRRREREREERIAGISGLGGLVDFLRPRNPAAAGKNGAAKKGQFIVAGVPGLQIQIAQCCQPVPGDQVIGYVTRGQGIRVHSRDCKNVLNAEQERLIDVVYEGGVTQEAFGVQFLVSAAERPGLLGELATSLGEQKINIVDCSITRRDLMNGEVQVWIKAEVTNVNDITVGMNRLKSVRNVFDVQRVTHGRR
jgi:GTP diphosphokinase / guanosine-3',5'-bis(diphosphate) 3'-diphosphatase